MTNRANRSAAPEPQSQATSHARQQQQERMLRLGALLVVIALLACPGVPSPLLGVDWRHAFGPALSVLAVHMPPEPIDLGLFVVPQRALGQWLYYGLAGFLSFVALTLIMHLGALYAQRTRPLGQPRTYLRLTVPASSVAKPADAVALLRSLHGMVPATNPLRPAPAPLMLCWTARPERKIQQALSLAGPGTLATSLQKRLQSIASGAKAVITDDPLLDALQPGRFLCIAEARTVAGDALPIAIVGRAHALLPALLSSLAPQSGIAVASARLVQEPILDRRWRLDVLASLDRMKLDTGADEQGALKAKAAGPAFRSRLLLLAVADDPQAGVAQVQTIAAALAASAQATALTSQRLQAGPVQVLPAVAPPRPAFPKMHRRAGLISGVLLASMPCLLLWRSALASAHPLLWAIPPLVLWLPELALAAHWRKRTDANLSLRHAAILGGVLPPRNPRVVPIWWPWLGRVE